jgi:hypothetical protein
MRALANVVAALALAGCPSSSSGSCPVDTVSSASQCIPIRDMAVPDMTLLSSTCPPESALIYPGGVNLPPCAPDTRCFYPVPGDGGNGPQECSCGNDDRWFCFAK